MDSNFEAAKNHFLRGLAFVDATDYESAEAEFRRSLEFVPNRSSTLTNLQVVLIRLGKLNEAFEVGQYLLQLEPDSPEVYLNLGNIQKEMGFWAAAEESYRQSLVLRPDFVVALNNLGNLFLEAGRYSESKVKFETALKLDPDSVYARSNLGALYMQIGENVQALDCLTESLASNPTSYEAWNNLGNLYFALNNYSRAVNAYERALSLNSETDWLFGMLLHARMRICDWKDYGASIQRLHKMAYNNKKGGAPFTCLGLPVAGRIQKKIASLFVKNRLLGLDNLLTLPVQNTCEKIKIAYLSSDFYSHATSYLIVEMIELHDRSRFEVIGICYGRSPKDDMRERVSQSFDSFIEVADMSDQDIAEILRAMKIDIAVDLKGHTQNNRLGILAARAAPIQIHYLGYPGTLGADFIDYLVADPTLVPVEHQEYYTEKIVYLPDTYQVNDRCRKVAVVDDTREDHGLPEEGFVFCCFNNNWKITPDLFDVWVRILKRVTGSVLWLLEDNREASKNLRAEAIARGISADRLVFARKLPLDQHLARHQHADLFLDTWYCNAHTTASDALWSGLPLISMLGGTFASRVGASLLNSIGLPELVVESIEAYEALAIELASTPGKLASIKRRLEDNRLELPLFDTPRFTSNLEKAYEAIWSRRQAGLATDHIYV